MQLINTVLFAASAFASLAAANAIHFVNQDSTVRTVKFTGQSDMAAIDDLVLEGSATGNVTFPTGWIGNFYSVSEGAKDVPGMLGEVRFDGFAGATYFDVSAIVNPNDVNGVKMLFPKNSDKPLSGCQNFPCANAYNKWDDVQTLSTDDKELICLLGNLSNSRKRGLVARMTRDFVTS